MTRHRTAQGTAQAGFTLIELMVVVTIVGVLLAVASISISKEPSAEDVGFTVATMLRETARKAVAGGAIDPQIIKNEGISGARTRLVIKTDGGTGHEIAVIERVRETPTPAVWLPLTQRFISHTGVDVAGYSMTAELSDGTVPGNALPSGSELAIECHPDGSCDAVTVYLERLGGAAPDRARVALIPLSGNPKVFSGW